ncbi:uncharacterized protein G2W53_010572 [Senna tora]|uniref:Uncharacterized protein n=1 Tax=Senna tora TaxID=362788 RepID=A0A834X063_9FABA|nr:uncharacterized protein G2W53_010572 [Senna tora]
MATEVVTLEFPTRQDRGNMGPWVATSACKGRDLHLRKPRSRINRDNRQTKPLVASNSVGIAIEILKLPTIT